MEADAAHFTAGGASTFYNVRRWTFINPRRHFWLPVFVVALQRNFATAPDIQPPERRW